MKQTELDKLIQGGAKVKQIKAAPKPEPPEPQKIEVEVEVCTSEISKQIDRLVKALAKPTKSEGVSPVMIERLIQAMPKEKELKPFDVIIQRDQRGAMMGARFIPVDE